MTATAAQPAAGHSDALLVERAQAGDMHAFELLVLKYRRRIQRVIARLVRDADLVEDIAQETFLRAYRALPQFRGESQFYTWLYRIAINTAKKMLLQRQHEPAAPPPAVAEEAGEETFAAESEPMAEDTPETLYAARELAQAVEQALADLPEDWRQAVTLREIDGLSYEDIAARMGSPIGTVRSRIFRAREAIAQRIRPLLQRPGGRRW
jgi:RNA polymerase sigma-70 factor (ECF subfamily)